ncbi:50S ribosomal protein L6 [Candidatus Micrarchaeota archaeon]|nr:50S ribosomal protein L6 [Candidatus Micrarchaeota archaeon]
MVFKVLKISEDTKIEITNGLVKVSGPNGSLEKKFEEKLLRPSVSDNEFKVETKMRETRRVAAAKKTLEAHVRNMIAGVHAPFEKKLQVVFAHFPVSIEIKGKELFIKNFLGEKKARQAEIVENVTVSVSGQEITVKGNDKEAVGQTASNIVRATRIKAKDIRVFQDGIYYS